MEKKNTKKTILEESMNLFAIHGYEGVSVADIAEAVGIKASSIYKHYKSKQDIFDSILAEMAKRYDDVTFSLGIEGRDPTKAVGKYTGMSEKNLIQVGTGLFSHYLHDDFATKFRKMLTIEQYKNPIASKLYLEQYIDSPLFFQSQLFKAFIGQKTMHSVDTKVAAMHFYAPIFLMLCLCDNCPERENEALESIKGHIIQFRKLYMIEGE